MSSTADITKSIKKSHRQLHSFDIYQKLPANRCSRTHMSQELAKMIAMNVQNILLVTVKLFIVM